MAIKKLSAVVPAYYLMRNGDIVKLDGYVVDNSGNVFRQIGDEFIDVPQNLDHAGYLLVNICNPRLATSTGFRSLYVQRVMMSSFHGESWFPTAVADHIDNNKQNNNLTNLQWLSIGDNNRKSRSIPVIVTVIDEDYAEYLCDSYGEAAKLVGCSYSTLIRMIADGMSRNRCLACRK